ncbi:Carbon monoxide dehydrogenase subunit G [Microbacterium sp. cf046]|uniref:SRPBCC family protein n=1 Tax=Microbacterium sp. cf046 TaxID=1761803 RepID=UPI0008DEE7A1|nr:SRPBCC family protein [Microbacterium sp. cf046]SFS14180.1 Carbon monoxide dehydrogenase subunit G [Microbacterium sp. cf046]
MNGFEFSEHIARPPEEVFAVISDPTRATAFLDNITESRKLTEGPIGVGTTFRETRVVSGKEASADLLVTAHEPNSHVGISTEAEGITVLYDYRLTPESEGTRITWTCSLGARGLRRMMLPMVAAIMKKEDGDHLQRLKIHIESS